ncbi:16256_t:CDS:2, partial [Racocetra persica]
ITNSQEIIDSEDITNPEDIMDSDILDLNEDFITPSKNFGIHWTGFLRSKEFKNDKAWQYNAKLEQLGNIYCDHIFEARKEAMTNHIINICRKISAEKRIFYSRIIKNKLEQVTEISTHKAVLMTDYFDKSTIPLEKATELHTLLLRALLYSNIPFNTNEIINIEDFSSTRHIADNLLIVVENLLKNVSISFDKIIAIVSDSPSVMKRLRKNVSDKYQHVIEIIISRRHFLENEQFTLILRYVVDAIAKLESNNITL